MTGGRGRWTAGVLAGVLLGVEAVIVAESWRGLTGFAHLIGIGGVFAWGVPVTLDGVSLVAALTALRAELAGEVSGLYRLTLFAFTAASASANWWHGARTGGTQAALYLGGMSIAVAVVFALALRQIRDEDRRRAGRSTPQLPRFSVAHWARYPGLTWRAWSLSVRDGHTSPRAALDAALARQDSRPGHPSGAPKADDHKPVEPRQTRAQSRAKPAPGRRSLADVEAEALAVLEKQPAISGAGLGRAVGVSPRSGQRLLSKLGSRTAGEAMPNA